MFNIKKYIPALQWLPGYGGQQIKGDLSAGLTVGMMLIPQGMAYAMIAGLPPIYGLYASTIPLILYAIFGTSRQLAVGPVAMVSLLVASGVGAIATQGTDEYIMLAVLLTVMVGAMQLAMGVFRMGFLVNFLSHPVISGFTSAAALIIGLNQLKHLLGIALPRSSHIHEILIGAIQNIGDTHLITLAIGLGGIALIIAAKKIHKMIPGPLMAVVFGILTVWLAGLDAQGVKIVAEVPSGLPAFKIPSIEMSALQDLFPIALTIALVGFMESIAVAKAIQAKHKNYKVDSNQELIGLGVANLGGALFQSYPVTGGFSRTAVNDQAGAQTGMASIISAVTIGLTLLFLTSLFYYLPNAILASVIMVAVFGLIDYKEAIHLWKNDRTDFFMLLATFIGTLSFGIEEGIVIGVALSLGMLIFRTTRPHWAVLGQLPGTQVFKNIERYSEAKQRDDVLIFRYDARLYFANIAYFNDTVEHLMQKKGDQLRLLVLDMESINSMDSSAVHAVHDLIHECKIKSIRVMLVGVKGPVRDVLMKNGLIDEIGRENFFQRVSQALHTFDGSSAEADLYAV